MFTLVGGGTVAASYWDTTQTGIADDTDTPPQPPEGRTTAVLQAPTDYDTVVGSPGEAIYAAWDDQDVDGNGVSGEAEDDDPWDFGRSNQHPILKYRGLAAAPQLDAQPDTAPAFATSTLAAMTFPGNVAIQPFQLPAVTGGNGAYAYTPSGLPAGLSLGTPNCATARTVCGTPTMATSATVIVTVDDGDNNMAGGDRDAVTFTITVPEASARVADTVPASLTEANLHGARVTVELSGTEFGARAANSPAGFRLTTAPPIAGLSVASATRTGATSTTLRLRFDGTDFDTRATLLVRVLAATHRFGGDLDTGAVAVAPTIDVALSETDLALDEAPGAANANVGTYTVVLTGQPPGAATVTPTSGNPDVTTSGALTFSATTWNTARTVTVTAGRDDDAADDVAHVTHAVQGVPGVLSGPRVRVTVSDDDVRGLTLATTTLAGGVTEGSSAIYAVRLDTEPTGPVTVAISGGDGAVTVDADSVAPGDQSTLLFHAMNWDTARTVTVRAREDDDGADGTATLTHDPSGADYGGVADADVTFAVVDDDAKGATPSATTLTAQENGSAVYTLVLDTEPVGGDVRVEVTSSATSTVTASPPALTFAAENWNVPQTITLSGVDDANTTDDSATVSHAATGADYGSGVTIADVSVTVADDDAAGLKVTPTTLTVAEGGTATYSVRLNAAPTATTTVTLGGATAKLTADADRDTPGDQWALIFDATNWNAARTVTVTAVADADGADETVGLTHAITAGAGDYASLPAARRPGVEVRVTDAETAGVVVEPAELTIDEGGTAEYAVSLSTPPASGTATVAVASSGAAGLTAATSTLSFDSTNWNTAQTVTVTAVADHDRLTDAEGALTHAVTNYGAVESGPDVRVTVSNATEDHDADADGLIEVDSLAKLNAMRWDLDGDGAPVPSATSAFAAAFPNPRGGAACPTSVSGVSCRGYELTTDLDFDTDGDGDVDVDDDYPNWAPIPTNSVLAGFEATFRGNGHVVDKLTVRRSNNPADSVATRSRAGLFGVVGASGRVESLGVVNASVRAPDGPYAGAVAGELRGRIVACYSTGSVSAVDLAGGLVGATRSTTAKDEARVVASYSTATVSTSGRSSNIAGNAAGLVGSHNNGAIVASYAAGRVSARSGFLYAGPPAGHGLSGGVSTPAFWVGVVRDSYWDTLATGQTTTYATSQVGVEGGDIGTGVVTMVGGLTTAQLQSPTGYAGVYAGWDVDLDGDGGPDDPWDFGSSSEYPSLKWGGFDVTKQFVGTGRRAETFGFSGTAPDRTFEAGRRIALFQVPAAVGGEGSTRYSARGLPSGMWFDGDGSGQCGLPRSVCGTPEELGSHAVTVTARDGSGGVATLSFVLLVVEEEEAESGPAAALSDPALLSAVAAALGLPTGSLTEGDLLSLTSLSVAASGVESLAGLGMASNLEELDLRGNALTSLEELSSLALLTTLDLSDNELTDVSALSGLTRLRSLLLSGNRVSDVSALSGSVGVAGAVAGRQPAGGRFGAGAAGGAGAAVAARRRGSRRDAGGDARVEGGGCRRADACRVCRRCAPCRSCAGWRCRTTGCRISTGCRV